MLRGIQGQSKKKEDTKYPLLQESVLDGRSSTPMDCESSLELRKNIGSSCLFPLRGNHAQSASSLDELPALQAARSVNQLSSASLSWVP